MNPIKVLAILSLALLTSAPSLALASKWKPREGKIGTTAYKVTPAPVGGRGDAHGYTITAVRADQQRIKRVVSRHVNLGFGPRVVVSKKETRTVLGNEAGRGLDSEWGNTRSTIARNPARKRAAAAAEARLWPTTP